MDIKYTISKINEIVAEMEKGQLISAGASHENKIGAALRLYHSITVSNAIKDGFMAINESLAKLSETPDGEPKNIEVRKSKPLLKRMKKMQKLLDKMDDKLCSLIEMNEKD